jgi:cytochrome b subunit of formate dehydrogenase
MIESRLIYRHRCWVPVTRWIVICMVIMLMSGLQIFNAHPALYCGNTSHFDDPLLVIRVIPAWTRLPSIECWPWGRR